MLCQKCQKREANVHYTQIINGNKSEMFLCSQCADSSGQLAFSPQLNLGDFLWGFPGLGSNTGFTQAEQPAKVRCGFCGMSFDDFRKTGKMGCANCYTTFRDDLNPILRRLHGNTEHTGKVPGKATGKALGSASDTAREDTIEKTSGNVPGNATGKLSGNISSNTSGYIPGNVSGNTLGNISGDISGNTSLNTPDNISGNTSERAAAKASGTMKNKSELDRLKSELAAAISKEEYERAAELRDFIRSLEGSGNKRGGV